MRAPRNTDDIAAMLEGTGRYRVLRRVAPIDTGAMAKPRSKCFIGVALDCEATGIDPLHAEPIEIAAVKFAYDPEGRILHLVDVFEQLQEPSRPLDPAVSRLVNLTDADLAGRRIDKCAFKDFLADVNIICAHNARYDRVLLEQWMPDLPLRPWACSLANIDWRGEGLATHRLGDILYAHRLFADGHRALRDVESLMQVLQLPLPASGGTAFEALLANARRCTGVVFAEGSAMAKRGVLKAREYRWASGEAGEPRAWWREIDGDAIRAEVEFLIDEVYGGGPCAATVALVSAVNRFRSLAQIAAVRTPALACASRSVAS